MIKSILSDKTEVRDSTICGKGTFAKEDIKKGEELTQDYGLLYNEDYSFKCNCGSENCRGTFTGFDWKRKELQNKYYDYFAAYLKEKILAK